MNANKVEDYNLRGVQVPDDLYTAFKDWASKHPNYRHYHKYALLGKAMESFMEAHKNEKVKP